MGAIGLQDLQFAVASGGRPYRGTTKDTLQVHEGPCVLLQRYVADPGTGWTVTIYDATAGTTDEVDEFVTADGKGRTLVGLYLANGLRVVSAGTTAGVMVLSYVPLET